MVILHLLAFLLLVFHDFFQDCFVVLCTDKGSRFVLVIMLCRHNERKRHSGFPSTRGPSNAMRIRLGRGGQIEIKDASYIFEIDTARYTILFAVRAFPSLLLWRIGRPCVIRCCVLMDSTIGWDLWWSVFTIDSVVIAVGRIWSIITSLRLFWRTLLSDIQNLMFIRCYDDLIDIFIELFNHVNTWIDR